MADSGSTRPTACVPGTIVGWPEPSRGAAEDPSCLQGEAMKKKKKALNKIKRKGPLLELELSEEQLREANGGFLASSISNTARCPMTWEPTPPTLPGLPGLPPLPPGPIGPFP